MKKFFTLLILLSVIIILAGCTKTVDIPEQPKLDYTVTDVKFYSDRIEIFGSFLNSSSNTIIKSVDNMEMIVYVSSGKGGPWEKVDSTIFSTPIELNLSPGATVPHVFEILGSYGIDTDIYPYWRVEYNFGFSY